MTQADCVLSTPPTNTPIDTTRRRFLTVAAVASIVGAGSLAAAAMASSDVPQAVTVLQGADPIYAVIERHRKASAEHIEAVRLEFAFEEAHDIEGEQREEYERVYAATGAAWDTMDEAGCDLVNTRPTTLAGILALCRYIKPVFGEDDQPGLPEHIKYDDDTTACMPEAFAHVIGRAIEELMKVTAKKGGAVMTGTAEVIQLAAFRKDGTTSAARRALLSPVTVPQTETGKNHRIRQQRYVNWRRADAVVGYWHASIKMNDAIERVQRAELPEGELHPESVTGTHMVLVGKYRAALMAKLLTPAPTAADIAWKRAAFKSGQHVYTDVKPERIERAIADDVEFLKAHPTRRSGKQGMDPEKLQKRHAWKAALRARVTRYAEQNGIDKSELAWLGRIKHEHLVAFADRHGLSYKWLLEGSGTEGGETPTN